MTVSYHSCGSPPDPVVMHGLGPNGSSGSHMYGSGTSSSSVMITITSSESSREKPSLQAPGSLLLAGASAPMTAPATFSSSLPPAPSSATHLNLAVRSISV